MKNVFGETCTIDCYIFFYSVGFILQNLKVINQILVNTWDICIEFMMQRSVYQKAEIKYEHSHP